MKRKLEPLLFGLVLSGLMSCLVSGIATLRALGYVEHLAAAWMGAWFTAWAVSFPVVLLAAPAARRVVRVLLGPTGN